MSEHDTLRVILKIVVLVVLTYASRDASRRYGWGMSGMVYTIAAFTALQALDG